MSHIDEDLLIAVVLGEAEPRTRTEVDLHLAVCEQCRKDAEEVRRVLRSASSDEVPDRGEDYGARVWARLEPRQPAPAVQPSRRGRRRTAGRVRVRGGPVVRAGRRVTPR